MAEAVPMSTGADGTPYTIAELARLIDNIKHIDPEARLTSMQELPAIAHGLGPERTRNELIPFLCDSIDDEDEILVAMAIELAKFVPLVGGVEFAHVLVPAFETLASSEEAVVRSKAVDGVGAIVAQVSPACVVEHFLPLVDRLTKGQWFTMRSSACGIYPHLFPLVQPEAQIQMLKFFSALVKDDTPMVRRGAASALKQLMAVVSDQQLVECLLPLTQHLYQDDQDSVRLLAAGLVVDIARRVPHDMLDTTVLPMFRAAAEDSAWRVRYVVAESIADLQKLVPEAVIKAELLPVYLSMLKDKEPEVRSVVLLKVVEFSQGLPDDVRRASIIDGIVPSMQEMTEDQFEHVRAALASVVMGLCVVLGKDDTIEHLLPIFLKLLRDDFSDVRLNIISHLDHVNKVIGIGRLSESLLPAIQKLAEDEAWRVRLRIIEYIPIVSKQLGVEFFDSQLRSLCLNWLKDRINAVRHAASINVLKLLDVFGPEWGKVSILPKVLDMARDSSFVSRLTTLFTVNILADSCTNEIITHFFLPAVCSLHADTVPNIRFNVAKTLELITSKVDAKAIESQVRPVLDVLRQDTDRDVQFFANRALAALPVA